MTHVCPNPAEHDMTRRNAVGAQPSALLADTPKIPGLDGRKMSKSYNNAVLLTDPPDEIDRKLSRMMTDPRRVRRTDPGDPQDCPAFVLHRVYCSPDEIDYVTKGCRSAGIGCLECKKIMIKHVLDDLEPIRERRSCLTAEEVRAALHDGTQTARTVAQSTMRDARRAIGLDG